MRASQHESMNLNRLAYFAAVVEAGSFTRAAERVGVTKAVVSQQISKLEEEVGVTLLLRTTRKVVPTDAGLALHARCRAILRESAEAFDELAEGVDEPRGTLRVTAPLDYGAAVVVPVVSEFVREFPRCDVELALSDRVLAVQTVDVAIRVGWLESSSHTARRIGKMEQLLVASASMSASVRALREPKDLASLPFVSNRSLPEPDVWKLTHETHGQRTFRAHPRIGIDATPAVRAAALVGAGLAVLPDYLVARDLAEGRLIHVLPAWKLRTGGIYATLPSARFRPAKVGRFLEKLARAEQATRIRADR